MHVARDILYTSAALVAALTALGVFARRVFIAVRRAIHLIDRVETVVSRELEPNSGSSMRDMLADLQVRLAHLEGAFTDHVAARPPLPRHREEPS